MQFGPLGQNIHQFLTHLSACRKLYILSCIYGYFLFQAFRCIFSLHTCRNIKFPEFPCIVIHVQLYIIFFTYSCRWLLGLKVLVNEQSSCSLCSIWIYLDFFVLIRSLRYAPSFEHCFSHITFSDTIRFSFLFFFSHPGKAVSSGKLVIDVSYFGFHIYSETDDICGKTSCPISSGDFIISHSQVLPGFTPPVSHLVCFNVSENGCSVCSKSLSKSKQLFTVVIWNRF